MGAALLELSISDSGSECSALERLEQALAALRREVSELRCEVGYWKRMHADAVARNERLTAELVEARGEIRVLQDRLFGRKAEKSRSRDRSNDLVDPEQAAAETKKRGAQPDHEGHDRRDYSHLPVREEFLALPEESLACPDCGKPAAMMSDTEDSELLEVEVKSRRRRLRRRRYVRRDFVEVGKRHWKINPQQWFTAYFESCAAAGGKAPDDIQPFLPWNLSAKQRADFADHVAAATRADTS